jgi:hypothetical protein
MFLVGQELALIGLQIQTICTCFWGQKHTGRILGWTLESMNLAFENTLRYFSKGQVTR